jgi:regulatory protein
MDSTQDLITALNADPLNPDRVHVFIDGRHAIVVSLDVAAAERLTVGQPCPPARLERLNHLEEEQAAYEQALAFLSYRPRSAREVEQRLRKKGHDPEQIERAIARLKRHGLVNDLEFSRFWVNNRMAFNPRGPRLLRSELRQKGVPAEVVDEVLQEQSEQQAEAEERAQQVTTNYGLEDDEPAAGTDLANALALARKRMRSYAGLDPMTARRRLSGFLARRGYDYGTVDQVFRRLLAEQDGEAIDE